jgi:hypothetical protein
MNIFSRIRRWFAGPAVDRDTQREATAAKERGDMSRLSQDVPGFNSGTVTPDRTPKPD